MLRSFWGVALLAVPDHVAAALRGDPLDDPGRRVARLLGARQLAQAALSAGSPGAAVLALGAEVDAAHSLTALGLAAVDPRRRRVALVDGVVAGAFAAGGLMLARQDRHPVAGGSLPWWWRQRHRIALALVPGRLILPRGDHS